MKNCTSILALAALATLSISALAPSSASAWGMRGGHGGYGGGHFGGHYGGGYRPMAGYVRPSYFPRQVYRHWYPSRPYYSPSYATTYPAPSYAPAPVVSYQATPSYAPAQPTYAVQPTAVPCNCEAPAPQAYVPPQPTAAPCNCEAPAPQAYVPPPQPTAPVACNCAQQSYAPQQDQPATQQMKPVNYASAELKKE
jgi:hypothetical protein